MGVLIVLGLAWGYAQFTNARDVAKACEQIEARYLRAVDEAYAEASMDWQLHKEDYATMGISREEAMLSTIESFLAGARKARDLMEEQAGIQCGR